MVINFVGSFGLLELKNELINVSLTLKSKLISYLMLLVDKPNIRTELLPKAKASAVAQSMSFSSFIFKRLFLIWVLAKCG